jgi:cyclophilin family peptidyl-prolyl cis-trans isomerase
LVDKPRRRKKSGPGMGKIAAIAVAAIIVVALVAADLAGYFSPHPRVVTYVEVSTSLGSFQMELFNSSAPKTVSNFLTLVREGFYDNLTWHRVEHSFVIQTGDPNTRNGGGNRSLWGEGTSGTYVPFEYDPSLHNYAGTVAMASTGAGQGGSSQFFINLSDNSAALDGKYAVFGNVTKGMSVVLAIGSVPTETVNVPGGTQDEPVTNVYVWNITILSGP